MEKIIHITEIGRCQRQYYYALNEEDRSPPHFTSLKGTITHSVLFQLLKYGKIVDESKEALLQDKLKETTDELFDKAYKESKDLITKAREWVNTTELITDKELHLEEEINLKYDGWIITGRVDLYTEDAIIDFKTSKKITRHSFFMQLAGYNWLLSKIDDRVRDRYLVFFGNSKPVEHKLSERECRLGDKIFLKELKNTILIRNRILENEIPECKNSYTCVMCPYRGICSGI